MQEEKQKATPECMSAIARKFLMPPHSTNFIMEFDNVAGVTLFLLQDEPLGQGLQQETRVPLENTRGLMGSRKIRANSLENFKEEKTGQFFLCPIPKSFQANAVASCQHHKHFQPPKKEHSLCLLMSHVKTGKKLI